MANGTAFGRELRRLRLGRGETQIDTADRLGVSVSFLSAVEVGKKKPPADLVDAIATYFELDNEQIQEMRKMAWTAQSEVRFNVRNADTERKEVVGMFARCFEQLTPEQLKQMKQILGG